MSRFRMSRMSLRHRGANPPLLLVFRLLLHLLLLLVAQPSKVLDRAYDEALSLLDTAKGISRSSHESAPACADLVSHRFVLDWGLLRAAL
ncbi:unnamed protein product [Mesocestoides corti]|uniref:Secreted protein n=1 Tax=Mesocestoides corti TaxID=53468 RepID=A0A0R3U529_MESCO|nr:unnamed protein product [Mesocestoides corti]